MSKHAFEKFISKPIKGAKKKEAIRQEKRKSKALLREAYELRKKEMQEKNRQQNAGKPTSQAKPIPTRYNKQETKRDEQPKTKPANIATASPEQMPLNKFLAHAGICGRREAAALIKDSLVTVNGDIVDEPGFKVTIKDTIRYRGKRIFPQKNNVYVLLNKPKDTITTANDPQNRKTVFDLVQLKSSERLFPVGRLDRNTTGVLLLTNDGDLAQKLTHPSFEIRKIYEVKLDKPLAKKDFEQILQGFRLDDGPVKVDALGYPDNKDKSVIGIELHSGRNRIVRRIFENFGYDVKNLDRVMFANLTKKNVDRGKWRFLNEKEIRLLKFMNQSFVREKKKEGKK